ncbi:hypothetical protein ANN_02864 [Periplaneta americana]|uniref:Uncharacterized protein n=1 Tax=Periplaneta americana TaxID=6978 RepID=A0ABQ8TZ56_PERAM|nr:hypothetical protein ANN_02864 [Periplaneta americana]
MEGLCEGGNKPAGSLKAICKSEGKTPGNSSQSGESNPAPLPAGFGSEHTITRHLEGTQEVELRGFNPASGWESGAGENFSPEPYWLKREGTCNKIFVFCQDTRDLQYGNNVSVERVGVEGKVGRVYTEFKAKSNSFPYNSENIRSNILNCNITRSDRQECSLRLRSGFDSLGQGRA